EGRQMHQFTDLGRFAVRVATSLGAHWADARVGVVETEDVGVRNGEQKTLERTETAGFGVRVLVAGAHGFASGYDLTEVQVDLVAHAERVRDEAIALLSADACPVGEKDVILGGDQLGLQIHESVGHATELDRVQGWEANFAGTSFVDTGKLAHGFRYGSEFVN